MFTQSGYKKLRNLKNELIAIQAKQYNAARKESSELSQQMVTKMLEVVQMLLDHNDIRYWQEEKNQKKLVPLIGFIDNNKSIYVPDVFNQESYDMAVLLKTFMEQFDINQDLDLSWTVKKFLEAAAGGPEKYISQFKQSIGVRINIFEHIQNAQVSREREHNLRLKTNTFNEKIGIQSKWGSDNGTVDLSNPQVRSKIIKEYQTLVSSYLDELHNVSTYVRFALNDNINYEKPFQFDKENIAIKSDRGGLVHALLELENTFNEKLKNVQANEFMSKAHNAIKEKVTQQGGTAIPEKFKAIIKGFKKNKESYDKGEHLPWYKSVDPQKKEALKVLYQQLNDIDKAAPNTENHYHNPSYRCCDALKEILDSIRINERIVEQSEKRISLGEFSAILHRAADELFSVIFSQNEADDVNLQNRLKKFYAQIPMPTATLANQ